MTRLSGLTLGGTLAGVVMGATVVTGGTALAADGLTCGSVITESGSYVLSHDLSCSGTAIVVGQAGSPRIDVEIDFDGHSIRGDGTGYGIGSPDIWVANVTLVGGSISGFQGAIDAEFREVTIDRMRLSDNENWIPRAGSPVLPKRLTITSSAFLNTGLGGVYTDTSYLTVSRSRFVDSSLFASSESSSELYGNSFVRGGFAHGVASDLVAVGNSFRDCTIGIASPGTDRVTNRIEHNRFHRCGTGLVLGASIVAGTQIVKGNMFIGNTAAGMTVLSARYANGSMVVSHNKFLNNGGSGLVGVISPDATGTVTVANNLAVHNAEYGINLPGAVDGGGNKAVANGSTPQCVGVVCS